MILKIFSIRDTKAESYGVPFFQPTEGEAERSFRTAVNDPKSKLSLYPEDFDLFYLGVYDDATGKATWEKTPQHRIKALACKKPDLNPISKEQ